MEQDNPSIKEEIIAQNDAEENVNAMPEEEKEEQAATITTVAIPEPQASAEQQPSTITTVAIPDPSAIVPVVAATDRPVPDGIRTVFVTGFPNNAITPLQRYLPTLAGYIGFSTATSRRNRHVQLLFVEFGTSQQAADAIKELKRWQFDANNPIRLIVEVANADTNPKKKKKPKKRKNSQNAGSSSSSSPGAAKIARPNSPGGQSQDQWSQAAVPASNAFAARFPSRVVNMAQFTGFPTPAIVNPAQPIPTLVQTAAAVAAPGQQLVQLLPGPAMQRGPPLQQGPPMPYGGPQTQQGPAMPYGGPQMQQSPAMAYGGPQHAMQVATQFPGGATAFPQLNRNYGFPRVGPPNMGPPNMRIAQYGYLPGGSQMLVQSNQPVQSLPGTPVVMQSGFPSYIAAPPAGIPQQQQQPQGFSGTLYLKDFGRTITAAELTSIFQKYNGFVRATIKRLDDDRIVAFVKYATSQNAAFARYKLQGTMLSDGSPLSIDYSHSD